MFDWNDLRYLIAVARQGSTLAAARALGVDQSTVQRRLRELESHLGDGLVMRTPAGYRLTEFGEALLPAAERVEAAVAEVARDADEYNRGLQGVIRLTCPEPLVARLSDSEILQRFHERYPRLRVEFVMSDRYLDLAKGEADVALRSGEPSDETLVGRRIADSIWAVYASQTYLQRRGRPQHVGDLARHELVGFQGKLAHHRAAHWFAAIAPGAVFAASNDSVSGVLAAVKSGIGIAPLPTAIADMHADLVQLFPPIEELKRGWYLLTRADLRRTPRVAAFFDFVVERIDLIRPILTG